jgi:hypothetical protein
MNQNSLGSISNMAAPMYDNMAALLTMQQNISGLQQTMNSFLQVQQAITQV